MEIKFTPPDLNDLEELRLYFSERSGAGLRIVLSEIEGTIKTTPEFFSSGRPTPKDDVREKITTKYGFLIPNHIRGSTLYILRIYRSMRKPLDYDRIIHLK
jgi:hypothetical protein